MTKPLLEAQSLGLELPDMTRPRLLFARHVASIADLIRRDALRFGGLAVLARLDGRND